MNRGAAHRQLMLLGMLLHAPMYGHQIKATLDAHPQQFADLKRGNMYYLLDQLATRGHLARSSVRLDAGGERDVYRITDKGRRHFNDILRETLVTAEMPSHPLDVALFFLPQLPRDEAIVAVRLREEALAQRVREMTEAMPQHRGHSELHDALADLVIERSRLELDWLRTIRGIVEAAPPHGDAAQHESALAAEAGP
jgi:DNA-binding PadR family transcriptional regulator